METYLLVYCASPVAVDSGLAKPVSALTLSSHQILLNQLRIASRDASKQHGAICWLPIKTKDV